MVSPVRKMLLSAAIVGAFIGYVSEDREGFTTQGMYVTPPKRTLIVGDSLTVGAIPYLAKYCPGADIVAQSYKPVSWMSAELEKSLSSGNYSRASLLGGINDIAGGTPSSNINAKLVKIVQTAEIYGVDMIFGTIPPFGGIRARAYSWTPTKQQELEGTNSFIKKNYAHVDTNALLASPENPLALNDLYERSSRADHLHLGEQGLEVLAPEISAKVCR